jgi:hypothetical protein
MSFLQQNQSQGQNGTRLKLRRVGEGWVGEQGGEMTQTMYAHNNNKKNTSFDGCSKNINEVMINA